MIPVTKTFFPSLEDYQLQLERIWKNEWLTNRGELVRELEASLKERFDINFLTLTTNGTLPIQIALKTLAREGEIITTPFSYVATTSSAVWENCHPVFVDIHPEYLTLDETKIEEAITSKTTAILATHVFGNPCNVEVIQEIALKHGLKVIYDAAHCFGVTYRGKSLFSYGDVSTCSFHATKIFHTGEGGAMFTEDEELHEKLFYGHNFGHDGPTSFQGLGINAKMSELQAAMGLAVLPYMPRIEKGRKKVVEYYDEHLQSLDLNKLLIRENTTWNYSYYPIILKTEEELQKVLEAMKAKNIFPRRYFYPSLNTLKYLNNEYKVPISEKISSRILCLPLYPQLTEPELQEIVETLKKVL